MTQQQIFGIVILSVFFALIMLIAYCSQNYSLNGIKRKTVGQGQHGTARWAIRSEVKRTYKQLPFAVRKWRSGEALPTVQGTIVGCRGNTSALVDEGDVHTLMIGAAGVGKTAYFLYPNI